MKKLPIILALVALVAGCGLQKKEEGFSGVTEKKDYVAQGFQYLQQSDITNAIQSFDLAIKQDPTNPDNYITLGQVYLRLHQPTRAIDTLTAATKVGSFKTHWGIPSWSLRTTDSATSGPRIHWARS